MGMDGVGSSVVISLAAVLWLVYLVPTWLRNREYTATERNAVRLQQTIRILAETAEIPDAVHLESNARTVAHQEKLVRQHYQRTRAVEKAKEAAMSRAAARTLATLKPSVAAEAMLFTTAARRLRRTRAVTTGVLAASVLAIGASFVPVLAVASGILLGAGVGVALAALLLLNRLASVARSRAAVARRLRARPAAPRRVVLPETAVPERVVDPSWTPVSLPKPLYLSKPAPQQAVSEAMVAEARERLIAEADERHRVAVLAEQEEKVTALRPAAASAWSRMGIVDAADTAPADLDAALRRRRAV